MFNFVMNSNAASILSFALSTGFDFSSQGKIWVGAPIGSAPFPQNECQYATANRKCSFSVLPATTLFSSYHLYAKGLSVSGPSYLICPIPLKYSLSPNKMFAIINNNLNCYCYYTFELITIV